MAIVTIGRRHSGRDVARSAGRRHRGNVHSSEGETGGGVVKYRAQPGARRMARLASLGIAGSDVIRDPGEIRGALPGRDVATVAGGGTQRVVVVYMARAAKCRRGHVRSRQGKPGDAVIERRVPARWRMAIGAVR